MIHGWEKSRFGITPSPNTEFPLYFLEQYRVEKNVPLLALPLALDCLCHSSCRRNL
jgi:hypothetical protein